MQLSEVRLIQRRLRKRGYTMSVATALKLAKIHGLVVARDWQDKRWWLFRPNGIGNPLIYRCLTEVINDLAL